MAVYIEQWMFVVFVFSCNYICTSKSNIIFDDGCNIIRTIFARKKSEQELLANRVCMREKEKIEREMNGDGNGNGENDMEGKMSEILN